MVRQRSAKPPSPVQIRVAPPTAACCVLWQPLNVGRPWQARLVTIRNTRYLIASLGLLLCASTGRAQPTEDVEFFGDFRLRLEADHRSGTGVDDNSDARSRSRLRARVGLTYETPINGLSFGVRLATNPGTPGNSPHQTMDGFAANPITLDRAFARYELLHSSKMATLAIAAGKQSYPNWQQTEVFWDEDIQPEGVSTSLDLTLTDQTTLAARASYFYLTSESWSHSWLRNDALGSWQLRYSGQFDAIKPTAAITGIHIADNVTLTNSDGTFNAGDTHFFLASLQLTYEANNFAVTGGIDVGKGGGDPNMPSANDLAAVAQARVNYRNAGLRYYYYSVEEASVPFFATSSLSQDNFPNSRGGGLTGFVGHRFHLDYRFHKRVSADIELYWQKGNADNILSFSEVPGRRMQRAQFNANMSF